ncbi:MAG: hypothetical protein ACEQSR_08565 [Candidatus Methylacidiphilales bacterium]
MPVLDDILRGVGIDESLIPDVIANKEDLKLDEILGSVKTKFQTNLLDDADFVKQISVEKLKGTDAFKAILDEGNKKGQGMTYTAFKKAFEFDDSGLTDEEKKDYFKAASLKIKEKFGGLKMDDVAKALENENTSLKAKYAELEAASTTLSEKLQSDFDEKLSAKEQTYAAQSLMLPFSENIKFGINGSLKDCINRVAAKFTVIAADGVVLLKDKTNPSFSAKIEGKEASYQDALIAEIKSFNAWVEKGKDESKKEFGKFEVSGAGGVSSATGFSKEEIAKMIEENK